MQRSMALGHCICDARRGCPCEMFTQQGYCPCAGERPEPIDLSQVRLTEHVHNAGCASKIPPAELEAVLARLPKVTDPAVLSGIAAGDDAGLYRLNGDVTLVQTVDVFTPCVDDPHTFGRICAANCLSDIYAMGGVPRTALSILGFPCDRFDGRIMYHMLAGAMEVLAEAGVALIGGHSIKDEEVKLGFAITGTVDAARAVERANLRVGDVLVLTKPLGTGVLCFSRQIGRIGPEAMKQAESTMVQLNREAAAAMLEAGACAGTDVTGFGLAGHLIGMARAAGVSVELWAEALPVLDGALEALRQGVVPGAVERNREYLGDDLVVGEDIDEARVNLALDAQTSGGLLIAVPAAGHAALLAGLARRGVAAATIGRATEVSAGKIVMVAGDCKLQIANCKFEERPAAAASAAAAPAGCCSGQASAAASAAVDCCGSDKPAPSPAASACCASAVEGSGSGAGRSAQAQRAAAVPPASSLPASPSAGFAGQGQPPASSLAETQRAFGALMRAAAAAGAVDEKTKELINFALVVMSRCRPCVEVHLKKARQMGLSAQQLEEAAWCAIAMGGAPVKMFYEEALASQAASQGGECCGH